MKTPLERAAPGIAALKPYVPGKPISELERELGITDSVKLASNESPLGPSPRVAEAISAAIAELPRYPDGGGYSLRHALAEKHGVSPEQVTLGNGSNDVLDMVARVFLYPGAGSLFSEHAFAVYPLSSQAVGAELQQVPAKDYGHDLDAMLARVDEHTRVAWVANPNNPTGTWADAASLRHFLQSLPGQVTVVVDEAYIEFVSEPDFPDASLWLQDFPNLIVTRTFSKVYGLAALRVGYGLSSPEVADLLNRVRQPFNVNSFAQVGALAALEDEDHLRRAVSLNADGMRQLCHGFKEMGLEYIPSVGNFVTVNLGCPAAEVDQALLREGVITRPVAAYGLPDHLRISVGLAEENARCLAALRKVLAL